MYNQLFTLYLQSESLQKKKKSVMRKGVINKFPKVLSRDILLILAQ